VRDEQIELAAKMRNGMSEQELASTREGAVELLNYLKANGYKTGLISDCATIIPKIWETTPLAPLIDVAVFSCITGMKKPDSRVYLTTTRRLEVKPEQCLYIADGIGQELASAARLGMHAVMIHTADDRADDPYREDWDGPKISHLQEVLNLVK
jgi:putative hydrolase of the HAD superfamily